ncbi:hypothetical protein TrRE_jg1951 [Triparma retinervis]|uniref:KH type-2 domain-containing protein n=1 Tax=Triparma retinervis TaxID=2557542 RepID=A0A9W7DR47_9STRA|nr:hypothetical protein TrRE_jg1951 [Triparma retinervis]
MPEGMEGSSAPRPYRSGFITIIGAPNMGKSTLLNLLLGQDLCLSTPKPQTTRHSILGILTDPGDVPCGPVDYGSGSMTQVAFTDTPGVVRRRSYKLHDNMMSSVGKGIEKGDLIIVASDIFGTVPVEEGEEGGGVMERIARGAKVVVLINKIDLADKITNKGRDITGEEGGGVGGQEEQSFLDIRTSSVASAVLKWRAILPSALLILPISATTGSNVPLLRSIIFGRKGVQGMIRSLGRPIPGMFPPGSSTISDPTILGMVPFGPPMFPADAVTDRSERFVASEIVRGAIFGTLRKEVPYATEVRVTGFTEGEKRRITAEVIVERNSQKGLVIGKGGKMIKEIGIKARGKLEEFFGCKIYLDLTVKVDKDWRKDEGRLKEYGYDWDR